MKRAIAMILAAVLLIGAAWAEEEQEPAPLYVMAGRLFGRIRPGKNHAVIVEFDMGTRLKPTGRMSKDHKWVEIETMENELCWCSVDYLTEREDVFHVYTLNDSVKIRKVPGAGKVTGYARYEQVLEITQVVMGYGRCERGWVDLEYFIEDCE